MVKYKIIHGLSNSSFASESLEDQVNTALHYGWRLFGSPFFDGKYAVQAMTSGEYDARPSQADSTNASTDRR